jgi:DNA-directed RNA polymerase subunit RPC12/RpoP
VIRFTCPTCSAVLNCPDHKAGEKAPCPKCGQRLQVPVPPRPAHAKTVLGRLADPPPPGPGPDPAGTGIEPEGPTPGRAAGPPTPDTVNVKCPGCGRVIPLRADELDTLIECKRCDTRFVPSGRFGGPAAGPILGRQSEADYAEPEAGSPVGGVLGRGGNHSGLGMASFLIAVLVGGMDVVLGLIVVLNVAGSRGERGAEDSAFSGSLAMVCLNCLSIPLCLVGVGLAVMALIAHKGRNHLMTYIGLGVNAVVILGVLGLYVIGSVSRH